MNISSLKQSEQITESSRDSYIRKAVNAASIGALRIALYHQTQDPFLAEMPVSEQPVRGGALTNYVVPREYHQEIRDKAFEFLRNNTQMKPAPTLEEAENLMTLYSGKKPTPQELDFGVEELAFEGFSRKAQWQQQPSKEQIAKYSVTIIGAGFSGMCAAIQLQQLGIAYRIIERHPEVGGTWHVNDYPEARVDVPTFLYQYKFEKSYAWKSFFAPVDELRNYSDYIADKYGIRSHTSFNTKLLSSTWDEDQSKWVLELEDGSGKKETLISNFVISATGVFGTPKLPDIPGIEKFQGKMFHTTQWDHDFDYQGKKVALIGTGSTGTQLSRAIASKASQFTIFQRTPNWVTPIKGYHAEIPEETQWMFDNMPGYLNWFIYTNYFSELNMQDLQELDPQWINNGGKVNQKNQQLRETLTAFIKSKVGHKEGLFEKLVPDHSPLSRRLVIDNEWYDTLVRDNVQLVADGIQQITEDGIIDSKGQKHEVDLIVLGAGFKVSKYLWPVRYQGRNATSIEDMWKTDGARAYKGVSMPNFPNFFMIYGPNAQARAGSFHSVVECLTRHISELIASTVEQDATTIEVKEAAYCDYNAKMDKAMSKLLWEDEQGGGSYYVNEHGRSGLNMPWRLHEFCQMIKEADVEQYDFDQ
ncbi:flavin-containing monooxygenase [Paraglaciecola arctica]|uniref:flavin-containing monooxygenase n=1 Tax=Paraglaciecola arctica TaxID=1128911 RepID=UPI001C075951|nr:NAD(P)/FAD-dependent oxidoreductase [Paraglaciecola arctica]MBU3003903.1 NAD(P)/FAD-dependent oxidoreductase [Paraglaciecola arctica]